MLVGVSRGIAQEERGLLHEHPTLQRMLTRSNELRRGVGLRPHRMSPELTKAAQDQANYMANTGSFSHYSNGGPWGRALRHRFFGGNVRENIAMGQGSVPHVFNTWRNSGGHWASIVSNTDEAGFGYAVGSGGTPYWVAVYGNAPAKAAPASETGPEEAGSAETVAAKPQSAPATYSTSSNSGRRLIFRRR
jgi:hypothetical protein